MPRILTSLFAALVAAITFSNAAKAEITYDFSGNGGDVHFSDIGGENSPVWFFPVYSELLRRTLCGTAEMEFDLMAASNTWQNPLPDGSSETFTSQTCDIEADDLGRMTVVANDSDGGFLAHIDAYWVMLERSMFTPLTNGQIVAAHKAKIAKGEEYATTPVYYSTFDPTEYNAKMLGTKNHPALPISIPQADAACALGVFDPMGSLEFDIENDGMLTPWQIPLAPVCAGMDSNRGGFSAYILFDQQGNPFLIDTGLLNRLHEGSLQAN